MTRWYQNLNVSLQQLQLASCSNRFYSSCINRCSRRTNFTTNGILKNTKQSSSASVSVSSILGHLQSINNVSNESESASSGSSSACPKKILFNSESQIQQPLTISKTIQLMKICNDQPTTFNLNSFKEHIINKTRLITNVEQCKSIVDELIASLGHDRGVGVDAGAGQQPPVISIDCEGVNLGQSGNVTLLQLYDHRENMFIFDIQQEPKLAPILKELLTAKNIVKIIHDCKCDAANLYNEFGIQLENIFDTQSAHAVIKMKEDNAVTLEKSNHISFTALCQLYEIPPNPFKHVTSKKLYMKNQKFWSTRPLTSDMITYAASDVLTLPILYLILKKIIETDLNMEKIFKEECQHRISSAVQKSNRQRHLKELISRIQFQKNT